MKYLIRVAGTIVSALLFVSSPAISQSQNPEVAKAAEAADPVAAVPSELVEKALAGDKEALVALKLFLRGTGSKSPEEITRRATALIGQIGREKKDTSTEALLRLIDQVASSAIDLVSGSQVVRIGVDKDFVPSNALIAWDFGPPDGTVAPGFERVLPNDGRIGGGALDGLRRPADNNLLNDGISGVERIEADVPDGEYRIILMTQNLGDRSLMSNPFGNEVVVNGSALNVSRPSPEDWAHDAILSNRGVQNIKAQAAAAGDPGAQGGGGAKGFISGDLDNADPGLFQRQQGGAIIITAIARGGKLIIELRGFTGGARSYLTGLMVEPIEQTSDLVLSREAVEALAPPELRLALEENILAAAADVLSQLDPAQGDPELVELPEPILDPKELASTSS